MTSDKNSSDNYTLSEPLQNLAKGTILFFIGMVVSYLLGFIGVILIARHWTQAILGIYSLAYSILVICATISSLGLNDGLARSIAYSRGKNELKKIPDLISASIFFSILAGILLCLGLFLFSEYIAQNIFQEPALIYPLKIFALAVPFYTLIVSIVTIFRGFDQVKPTIYFQNLLVGIFFLITVVIIIISDLSFINVFYAVLFSFIIISVTLLLYAVKKLPQLPRFSIKAIFNPTTKELLIFSLPLFATSVFGIISSWLDTLVLGSFKSASDVGLYNVVTPLAQFLNFPLMALWVIFIPIFSVLYAKGLLEEIKKNYLICTKWIFSAIFPIFIMLFLFSEPIINFLYGPTYVYQANSNALRILSFAFIFNIFTGPSGAALLVMGKSKLIMFSTLFTLSIDIILLILLVPPFGLIGAAIATGTTIISQKLITNGILYSLSKIQPLNKNIIKPILLFTILVIPIYFLTQRFLTITWWLIILLFILLYTIYFMSILVTRSLDEDDLKFLLAVQRKTGIKLSFLSKIITKFL